MANLLDGIRCVKKEEMAKQICEFEVNRISVLLQIILQCVHFALKGVVHLVMKLFKKDIALPKVIFWKERYERKYQAYMELDELALEEILYKQLKRKLPFRKMSFAKSEDKMSAEITEFVAKLYGYDELKGMSVLEKNDYIFQRYPHQKKLDERMCLYLWLIIAFFVAGISIVFIAAGNKYGLLIALICVIGEILWAEFIAGKLNQWQLAHFVWLSASGLGESFSAVKSSMPSSLLGGQKRENNVKELLAYHTMISMENSLLERQEHLQESKHQAEALIAENDRRLRQLQLEEQTEEVRRILQDKGRENKSLSLKCEEYEKEIAQLASQLKILSDSIDVKEAREREKLKQLWEKAFPKAEFEEKFLQKIIEFFTYDDFEQVEQRLTELSMTKDPFALAERRKSQYRLVFRTSQGDIAAIYFKASKQENKRICLCDVEREEDLKEIPMSREEIGQLLVTEDSGIKELYEEVLSTLSQKEQLIGRLKRQEETVRKQKDDVEKKLQQKISEAAKLNGEIGKKQKECELLKKRLSQTGNTQEQFVKLKRDFLEKQAELAALMEKSAGVEKELLDKRLECEQLSRERLTLQEEMERVGRESLRERESFEKRLNAAIEEKKQAAKAYEKNLAEKLNELNVFKKMYENAAKENKETVRKLEQNIISLEGEVEQSENRWQKAQEDVSYLMEKCLEEEQARKQAREELSQIKELMEKAVSQDRVYSKQVQEELEKLYSTKRKVLEDRWQILYQKLKFADGVTKCVVKDFPFDIKKLEESLMLLERADDPMRYNERGSMSSGDAHFHTYLSGVCVGIFFQAEKQEKKVLITKIIKHSDKKNYK